MWLCICLHIRTCNKMHWAYQVRETTTTATTTTTGNERHTQRKSETNACQLKRDGTMCAACLTLSVAIVVNKMFVSNTWVWVEWSGVDVCLNIHNAFAIYSFVCAMYVCSCTAFSRPLNVDRPILLTSIPIAILNESTYYCIPMNDANWIRFFVVSFELFTQTQTKTHTNIRTLHSTWIPQCLWHDDDQSIRCANTFRYNSKYLHVTESVWTNTNYWEGRTLRKISNEQMHTDECMKLITATINCVEFFVLLVMNHYSQCTLYLSLSLSNVNKQDTETRNKIKFMWWGNFRSGKKFGSSKFNFLNSFLFFNRRSFQES